MKISSLAYDIIFIKKKEKCAVNRREYTEENKRAVLGAKHTNWRSGDMCRRSATRHRPHKFRRRRRAWKLVSLHYYLSRYIMENEVSPRRHNRKKLCASIHFSLSLPLTLSLSPFSSLEKLFREAVRVRTRVRFRTDDITLAALFEFINAYRCSHARSLLTSLKINSRTRLGRVRVTHDGFVHFIVPLLFGTCNGTR